MYISRIKTNPIKSIFYINAENTLPCFEGSQRPLPAAPYCFELIGSMALLSYVLNSRRRSFRM